MTLDTSATPESREEPSAPAEAVVPTSGVHRSPFTLAALLDLNDEELAQPPSPDAPQEHRWEQLSFGVTPETGEAIPSPMITGDAQQPPRGERALIPGLETPGAIEIPVYLAGRTLQDLAHADAPRATDQITDPALVADADDDLDVSQWTVADVSPAELVALTSVGDPEIAPPPAGRRRSSAPPAADFTATGDRAVLWPRGKPRATPSVLPQECAKCGAPSRGEPCAACGHDTTVTVHHANRGAWHHFVAVFLDSDSRLLRTAGALVLAPGELTSAYLAGKRRRYFGPTHVGICALLLFGIVSAIGGLRPRPDRALIIGAERTVEYASGVADRAQANLAVDAAPDLIHDPASALDAVPLLWLPLMAFAVVAVVAVTRTNRRRDDHAELVFAVHFATWFALWWGVAVPLLLLLTKFGFEYAAAWQGLDRVRYVDGGQIDGLSTTWNAMRGTIITPGFHTLLLALGIAPWAVGAYRRAFDSTWMRAGIAGLLVTAVPLWLLAPFA